MANDDGIVFFLNLLFFFFLQEKNPLFFLDDPNGRRLFFDYKRKFKEITLLGKQMKDIYSLMRKSSYGKSAFVRKDQETQKQKEIFLNFSIGFF